LDERGRFHRKAENFRSSWFVGADIDNDKEITVAGPDGKKQKIKVKCEGEEYLTFEQALNHPLVKQYGGIVYTTAGHKPDHHKFRILFVFDEEVTSKERFEQIVRALIWAFKSDESCKDASRFYFGAGENGQVIVVGNYLTNDGIDKILRDYDLAHAPHDEWKSQRDADDKGKWASQNDFSNADERREMYGKWAIDNAVRMIDESVAPRGDIHGNRHQARLRAARLLGGYVAGGLLDYWKAREALADAVQRNTDDFTAAMQTVDDGLANGQSSPITFEDKERERGEYLRRQADSQPASVPTIIPETKEETHSKKEALRQLVREWTAKEDEYTATRRRATSADFAALSTITAELAFSDKSRVGLQSLIALSNGCSSFEWKYEELFPYLRRFDPELFDMLKEWEIREGKRTPTKLAKRAQSRINGIVRPYLDAIDKDQDRCGIKLADTKRGSRHIDEEGNEIFERSETSLPILSYLEEIDALAKSNPSYSRASKRIRAEEARLLAGRITKYTPAKIDKLTPHQEIVMTLKRAGVM
jgi:hypothetical protein